MKHWLFILMLLPGAASATAYKCMDRDGGMVYSTTPCGDSPGLAPYVASPATSDGRLVLRMDGDHGYRIQGTINGSPVTLVLDAGAARTAISDGAAAAAGIPECAGNGHAVTAKGGARGCSVTVHEISFGGFELNNVVVNITPNMPEDARLGKDVLKRLKVQQADGALYVSRR